MPKPPKQSRERRAALRPPSSVLSSKPSCLPSRPPSSVLRPLSQDARATAIRAEEERALIRQTMSILGSRKSKTKAAAARRNAKAGGRPVGSRDSKPRKPQTKKAT